MFDVSVLKDKVLNGYEISKEDALNLVSCPLDELLKCADEIRNHFCGNSFDICTIINIKSGRCSEDCKFCAQSNHYDTHIDIYPLLNEDELKKRSLDIIDSGINRISYVASGRKITNKEFSRLTDVIQDLTSNRNVNICVSLGLLTNSQISKLKDIGVDRIHNNLESSENYFKNICTTHSYEEKLKTIQSISNENLTVCCGGIFGLGETFEDRIDLAILLRNLNVKSIPVNILNPIEGTPYENNEILSNDEVCRLIAVFRFINPDAFIRLAGGRALLPDKGIRTFKSGANAAISGNMLTTDGISIEEDLKILDDLGYKVTYSIK